MTETVSETLTGTPRTAPATPRRRGWRIGRWVLLVVLSVQFAIAGAMKVTGAPQMVDMFADLGAGQWFRFAIGALEIAGAIGLLIGRTRTAAALGIAALMVGATIARAAVLGGAPVVELAFLVLAGTVVVAGHKLRTQH